MNHILIVRLFFLNRARILGKPKMLALFYFSRISRASSNKSFFFKIYCSIANDHQPINPDPQDVLIVVILVVVVVVVVLTCY